MKSDITYRLSNMLALIMTSIVVAAVVYAIQEPTQESELAELSLSISEDNASELMQETTPQEDQQIVKEEVIEPPQEPPEEDKIVEQEPVTEPLEMKPQPDTKSDILAEQQEDKIVEQEPVTEPVEMTQQQDPQSDILAEPLKPTEPKPIVTEPPKNVTEPLKKDNKPIEKPRPEQRASSAAPSAKSVSAAAQFNACLQAKAKYPTSKEARLQNPHGTVGVQVTLSGSTITAVTITASSGSALLDQAAKSGILSSDCGALAAGMPSLTGRIVY